MIGKILSKETCAECKICCVFNEDDIWETPVISEKQKNIILSVKPEQIFVKMDEGYIFKMEKDEQKELYYCPMISPLGCMLGDDKPFDCRIWPFRVMALENKFVITISPVCESVNNKSINELTTFLEEGLDEVIFEEARKNPIIVKKYIAGYPILASHI